MDTGTASANSKGSDVLWVSSKVGNVSVHPLQRITLVNEGIVSGWV